MKTLRETIESSHAKTSGRTSSPVAVTLDVNGGYQTLIDQFLVEQRTLTAVEKFVRSQKQNEPTERKKLYRDLIPLRSPQAGEQYAFSVDLDKCSGCKACVSACHSLNGLDDNEVWRTVGLLASHNHAAENDSARNASPGVQQHITTACHHCVEPGCLEGCPVLAYDKDPVTGIVRHLDDQCIGCSYCVMKCPYEVPRYNSRLGIVRKCDMCANRLAVGEAPACAQACPSEAIQITIVKPRQIKSQFRRAFEPGSPKNDFLPDSPDPRITLPTTQFVSQRGLPVDLFAADRAQPRLDEPHWPLAIMLLLTQAGTGMFFAAAIAISVGISQGIDRLVIAAFTTFVAGMAAAGFHLGQPLRAWRCFLGWRKSWLSREIIVFNAFMAMVSPAVVISLARELHLKWLLGIASAPQDMFAPMVAVPAYLSLVVVFTSAMVYADTHRPFWRAGLVFGNFFGATFLLGAIGGGLLFAWSNSPPAVARWAIAVALAVQTLLFIWRRRRFHAALRDANNPIHLNARSVSELLPGTTRTLVVLFVLSILAGLLAFGNFLQVTPIWMTFAALTMFGSEVIARHVFFVASASKRMPGGVAA